MSENGVVISKEDEIAALRFVVQILSENGILSEREKEKILSEDYVC